MKWFVACLALNACFAGTALADGQGAGADPKAPSLVSPESNFLLAQPVNGWTFIWQLPEGTTPPEHYELWKDLQLDFDPKDLLGG